MKIKKQLSEIKFDLEDNFSERLFALFAGLKMYSDLKERQHDGRNTMSIAGAEAYCMLQEIKDQFPKEYQQCALEYKEVYGDNSDN